MQCISSSKSKINCHILLPIIYESLLMLTNHTYMQLLPKGLKGILWQFYKLGLKVPSGRDENDGIGHFAELGSSWPGEAKTWPKIALRVGGRAENCVLGDDKSDVLKDAARPSTRKFLVLPPVHIA